MRHDQDSDEQEAEARSYRVPMRVLLCEAILNVPNCLRTLFVRGAVKPWIANTSLIVTGAVRRLIGRGFQKLL